jgi:peptidoglycan/xylan/chitin deacetylase (PgdA/CDA1 family)
MNKVDALLRPFTPLIRPFYAGAGLILMYHRVTPDDGRPRNPSLEVTPQVLEEAILYFARRDYAFCCPADLDSRLRGEKRPVRPFVLFTFDDGYRDNLTHAYPIFQKHNLPFTVHVTTGLPDRTAVLWWYLLDDLLAQGDLEFESGGKHYAFQTSTPGETAAARAGLRKLLKYADLPTFRQLVDVLFEQRGLDPRARTEELALGWDQVRELAADPLVTIGAHTKGHFVLSRLTESEVREEIGGSKRILEEKLGRPVVHLAYPYGFRYEAGEREFCIAAECGFRTAMTTRTGNVFPAHAAHPLTLPRYEMGRITVGALDLVASGAMAMRVNRFRRVITA